MNSYSDELKFAEKAILSLESELGIRLTVIDFRGSLRNRDGSQLLGAERQSHKTNAICRIGFCSSCIDHCRHECNRRGESSTLPFYTHCWKGLREIAVPLRRRGVYLGLLYAGIWRSEKEMPEVSLPRAFHQAWQHLPIWDDGRAASLSGCLSLFAGGLLQLLDPWVDRGGKNLDRRSIVQRFFYYHFAEPVCLDDLAAELHLSPSRTAHVLKDLFGAGFRQLLRRERVAAAKMLLRTTDRTAGEIGIAVGFADPYHFQKAFQQETGMARGDSAKNDRYILLAGREILTGNCKVYN